MKEVCAVVATYNRRELLEKCIWAILNQKNACCDTIVVDNGSEDGTEQLFSTVFKQDEIKYYNLGENLGSAGSQAWGIKEAVKCGYKYIWLMDDDVIPYDNSLEELLKADDELGGNWGILSSVAYWTDGSICESNRQKKSLFRFMNKEDYNKRFVKACMVSAASMFIKAKAVRDVGLPIAEYFFYTDDYEFSSRIGRKYPVYVVPASKVTHAMKANMKANLVKDTPDRLYRYEHLYRNDVHCYGQFGLKGYAYLSIKFLYTFLMVVLKEKHNKKKKICILIKGYHDGFRFRPVVERVKGEIMDFQKPEIH